MKLLAGETFTKNGHEYKVVGETGGRRQLKNTQTGRVTAWIDITSLLDGSQPSEPVFAPKTQRVSPSVYDKALQMACRIAAENGVHNAAARAHNAYAEDYRGIDLYGRLSKDLHELGYGEEFNAY